MPEDPAFVGVAQKDSTVWTLTGVKKGTTGVRIVNADDTIEKTITVTIANSLPMVIKMHPRLRITPTDPVDEKGSTTVTAGKRRYHFVAVPWERYFKDADGLTDINDYIVMATVPDDVRVEHVVVKTAPTGIVVDVIKKIGSSFSLNVQAMDMSSDKSEMVTLSVDAVDPLANSYTSGQERGDGDLETLPMVWRRYGATHSVEFLAYAGDGTADTGFNFVESYRAGPLSAKKRVALGSLAGSYASVVVNPASVEPASESVNPNQYYTVKASGSVNLVGNGLSFASGKPKIDFMIKGAGSSGSVVITYHVATCDQHPDTPANCAITANYKWDNAATKTLRMSIVSSS